MAFEGEGIEIDLTIMCLLFGSAGKRKEPVDCDAKPSSSSVGGGNAKGKKARR